ncbi:glycoside hydrolase superfamily [Rhypophila decipiens]|uniref:Alpha-galactosidase n=1 Tax=Rhypophila decipiens TaxID=261697 RepID=A0AAN6Y5L8_9PEZI|nr:glycoside hydrolase superfamily [Rhypophila decipiens]
MLVIYVLSALVLAGPTVALVSRDGTGRLPAMGWNSWNEYGCDIKETDFIKVGQLLILLGLKDLGYEYVNIDDCWSDKQMRRDPSTKEILPDKTKFPQGISHTAQVIHSLGLKLGIYSDADLKYDNCNVPAQFTDQFQYSPEGLTTDAPTGYDWGASNTAKRYNAMRDALLKQNRTIQYSLCAWGHAHVEQWGNHTGHSWRMWGDIMPAWEGKEQWSWGLMPIVNQASFLWNTTNFWGHNDWDMLEVGNGQLTIEENRSHFAMWCILKSPLIIGTRLDTIAQPILEILSNKELIAFNQDPVYGASARPFKWGFNKDDTSDMLHPAEYWVGTSVKGLHLFMLNTQDKTVKMQTRLSTIPALSDYPAEVEYLVHDMWTGKDLGRFSGEIALDVAKHDTAALRITTIDGTTESVS